MDLPQASVHPRIAQWIRRSKPLTHRSEARGGAAREPCQLDLHQIQHRSWRSDRSKCRGVPGMASVAPSSGQSWSNDFTTVELEASTHPCRADGAALHTE